MGIGTGKSVVLSFDDGPEPVGALDGILAIFKRDSIVAEFFVIGSEVQKQPNRAVGGWAPYDPELAKVARELSLKIQNWDIDTNDWKVPRGIGAGKLGEIQKQFAKQGAKTRFNVLLHVQAETAKDLPAFIKQLKDWGFGFARP